jgi:hypothetical protein
MQEILPIALIQTSKHILESFIQIRFAKHHYRNIPDIPCISAGKNIFEGFSQYFQFIFTKPAANYLEAQKLDSRG